MTTNEHDHGTTLVLGGTGKTGRRIAQRLRAAGRPVRIGSRGARPPFDWGNRSTWASMLGGTSAVYVAFAPDVGFPGAAETVGAFAEQAVRAGVRRLVLLSGRGEDGALRSERAVRESGADWTIVRSSFFAQNFSEDFLVDALREGLVAFPADQVAEPFIDVEDLAEVAVSALTQDGHTGEIYEVTGPRSLTFAEAVADIGRACGRELAYRPVSPAEFAAGLVAQGVPEGFAAQLTALFAEVLDGRNAQPTDGVRRALGRDPRDFREFAADAAATGVWDVPDGQCR